MVTKKLLKKNNPENTIVRVIFNDKLNKKYECVGVLIKDEKKFVRIAFNAKDDKVVDYLDIKRSKITQIDTLGSSEIKSL